MAVVDVILFVSFILLLIMSGAFLVKSLSVISRFLRLSEFIIGSLLLAFATSLPEFFLGLTSALAGENEIALGNIIGANLLNLTLVVGIPVLLARGIKVGGQTLRRSSILMLFYVALPMVLMLIGDELSRIDGIILVLAFLIYLRRILKKQKLFTKRIIAKVKRIHVVMSVTIFIFSVVLLYYSSFGVILHSVTIAQGLEVPPIFMGLFLIAFGTTLPELIAGSGAVLTKHRGLTLGNIIGSVIFNSTIVLGVSAIIHPIKAPFGAFLSSSIFMLFAAFLFIIFLESGREMAWKEGLALILFYVIFLIVELSAKNLIF